LTTGSRRPIIYHAINTGYHDLVKLLLIAFASINAPTRANMLRLKRGHLILKAADELSVKVRHRYFT
jgi:hypothetical protein